MSKMIDAVDDTLCRNRPYFIEGSVPVSCCNAKKGAISIAGVALSGSILIPYRIWLRWLIRRDFNSIGEQGLIEYLYRYYSLIFVFLPIVFIADSKLIRASMSFDEASVIILFE